MVINKHIDGGLVIMVDGPDGVGKSTQIRLLADTLQAEGFDVMTTRIFGGTPIGEALRSVLFSDTVRPVLSDLHVAMAMYFALAEQLGTERQLGKVIIVDRSPLSIIAYQVYGDHLAAETGYKACDETMAALRPDKIVLLSASFEVRQQRKHKRSSFENNNYYEHKDVDYVENVINGYKAAAEHYQINIVDSEPSSETVNETIMNIIEPLLSNAKVSELS